MEEAREWLQTVLGAMGLPTTVDIIDDYLEIPSAELSANQKSALLSPAPVEERFQDPDKPLGDDEPTGVTLDALQYLANTLLNIDKQPPLQRSYAIELDGYRRQRHRELHELAQEAVTHVRTTGRDYEFTALSAAERRQIHTLLSDSDYADLETISRGREPHRRLVVRLATQPLA